MIFARTFTSLRLLLLFTLSIQVTESRSNAEFHVPNQLAQRVVLDNTTVVLASSFTPPHLSMGRCEDTTFILKHGCTNFRTRFPSKKEHF